MVSSENLFLEPLACVDVVGKSVLERTVERLLRAGVEIVTVLASASAFNRLAPFRTGFGKVMVRAVNDLRSAIDQQLSEYSQSGIEHAFVNSANAYAETDLLDLFYFHREAKQTITRTFDREGALALSVVDCARAQQLPVGDSLSDGARNSPSYFIREYVIRLSHPRDLRQLGEDILRGRCERGPCGEKVRPGIWIADGAEVDRRARVVAPAYIGAGSKVLADTLITRFSVIERGCYIDCGSVIEDSSILPGTRVGIWLDVCHAIVEGSRILSLPRDVMIEISDPTIIRSLVPIRRASSEIYVHAEKRAAFVGSRECFPAPDMWQLGVNPIQE
ncbi:MAG: hypothetical protein WB566_12385 [Terriglobales bacterium]